MRRRSLATVCSSSGTLEACCLSTARSTCSRFCQIAVSRRRKSLSLSSSSPPLWLAKVELVAGVTFTGLGPRDFLSSVGTAGAVEGFRGITKDPLRAACSKAVTLSFSVNLTDPSGTRGRGANGATSPGATNLLLGTTCAIQGRHSTSGGRSWDDPSSGGYACPPSGSSSRHTSHMGKERAPHGSNGPYSSALAEQLQSLFQHIPGQYKRNYPPPPHDFWRWLRLPFRMLILRRLLHII